MDILSDIINLILHISKWNIFEFLFTLIVSYLIFLNLLKNHDLQMKKKFLVLMKNKKILEKLKFLLIHLENSIQDENNKREELLQLYANKKKEFNLEIESYKDELIKKNQELLEDHNYFNSENMVLDKNIEQELENKILKLLLVEEKC